MLFSVQKTGIILAGSLALWQLATGVAFSEQNAAVTAQPDKPSGNISATTSFPVAQTQQPGIVLKTAPKVDPCQAELDKYQIDIHKMANNGWQPPKPPTQGVWETELQYDVTQDAKVQNVTVVHSSGFGPLDQSAVTRVENLSGQFAPLPTCFKEAAMEVHHKFSLTLH